MLVFWASMFTEIVQEMDQNSNYLILEKKSVGKDTQDKQAQEL
jgi:hypothetical protein